jgi:hypothetical protein
MVNPVNSIAAIDPSPTTAGAVIKVLWQSGINMKKRSIVERDHREAGRLEHRQPSSLQCGYGRKHP